MAGNRINYAVEYTRRLSDEEIDILRKVYVNEEITIGVGKPGYKVAFDLAEKGLMEHAPSTGYDYVNFGLTSAGRKCLESVSRRKK